MGWAVSIAKLSFFEQGIAANGLAVVIKERVTSGWAASIIVGAGDNEAIRALKITGGCVPSKGVLGTHIGVVTGRWAIAVARFIALGKIISANRSAIVVVEVVAPWSTAPIIRGARGDGGVGAISIALGCRAA